MDEQGKRAVRAELNLDIDPWDPQISFAILTPTLTLNPYPGPDLRILDPNPDPDPDPDP